MIARAIRLVTTASRCRSSVRRSISRVVRQAGQSGQTGRAFAGLGARARRRLSAWHPQTTWASLARLAAASASALALRSKFHLPAVEAHARIVAQSECMSMRPRLGG
jgi:hypothetical protein